MMSLPLTGVPLLPAGGGLGPQIPALSATRGLQAPRVVAPFVASALSTSPATPLAGAAQHTRVNPWATSQLPAGYVPGTLGPGRYAPYQPPFVPAVYSPGGPDSNGLPPPGSAGPRLIWAEMAPVGANVPRFMPSALSAEQQFSAEGPGRLASWGMPTWGGPKSKTTKSGGGAWDTASKVTSAAAPAAGVAVAAAGLAAFPFGTIATLAVVGVAAGFKIAAAVRSRRLAALAGDEAAVGKWAERAARWGKQKRKKVAVRLLNARKRLAARIDRRDDKNRKVLDTKRGKLKLLDMKLGVLYAMESSAVKTPKAALIEGAPETVPVTADAIEASQPGWVMPALIGGGGLLAAAVVVRMVRR